MAARDSFVNERASAGAAIFHRRQNLSRRVTQSIQSAEHSAHVRLRPARRLPPDSDLDLLVSFAPDADWSLMDRVAMEEELAGIMGRKVDLVSRRAVERSSNWIRRKAILESAEPCFASR
jgi:predicted nucleotidyltransferase